jgi:hypothetical protein
MEEQTQGTGGAVSPEPARRRRAFLMGAGLAGAAGVAGPLLRTSDAQAAAAPRSLTAGSSVVGAAATTTYLPLPTGTPAVGDAPVVTSSGSDQTTWTGVVPSSDIGATSGVAPLDGNTQVATQYLPLSTLVELLIGTAAPTTADGYDGDYWINESTGNLWGPKADSAWPASANGQISATIPGWGGFQVRASTGASGYAMADSTDTILSWTVPGTAGDGDMHEALLFGALYASAATTGGNLTVSYVLPNGVAVTGKPFITGTGLAAGTLVSPPAGDLLLLVESGSTVSIQQSTDLTGGASVFFGLIRGV